MANALPIPYLAGSDSSPNGLIKTYQFTTTTINSTQASSSQQAIGIGTISLPILPLVDMKVDISVITGNASIPSTSSSYYIDIWINLNGTKFSSWACNNKASFNHAASSTVLSPGQSGFAKSLSFVLYHKTNGNATRSTIQVNPFTIKVSYYNIGWETA